MGSFLFIRMFLKSIFITSIRKKLIMKKNLLTQLVNYGQSVWYDNIQRSMLISGELKRLVAEDGVRGVTSNPSIFMKAIQNGIEYGTDIRTLAQTGKSVTEIYETLAVADIRAAADVLYPIFIESGGVDGYVSMEVSPTLAHDTQGTIEEARRLFKEIGRENIMIKIPATLEGIPAIEAMIAEGININATLLFSVQIYRLVMEAYLNGLEKRNVQDLSSGSVSVASFFVSRVDSLVDKLLQAQMDEGLDPVRAEHIQGLLGKAAISNARVAYKAYREVFASDRFAALAKRGAKPQRILWASTSTKSAAYPDTLYVDELIGAGTVNTLPPVALEAFRDHGVLENSLDQAYPGEKILADLKELEIDIEDVAAQLLKEGVEQFVQAFNQLLSTIGAKSAELVRE
jgi:transaldolase